MSTLNRRALLAYLIVCIAWGSTYIAIRVAVRTLPPFLMAGSRFLIAGALLAAYVQWRRLPWPDGIRGVGHVAGIDRAVSGNILTEVSSSHNRAGLEFGLADVRRITGSVSAGVTNEQSHCSGVERAHVPGTVMNVENIHGNTLRVLDVGQVNRNLTSGDGHAAHRSASL